MKVTRTKTTITWSRVRNAPPGPISSQCNYTQFRGILPKLPSAKFSVSGYLLNVVTTGLVTADLQILPTNRSVLFLKQRNVCITKDIRRIALDLNNIVYEEVISTVQGDLVLVHSQKKVFISVTDLK